MTTIPDKDWQSFWTELCKLLGGTPNWNMLRDSRQDPQVEKFYNSYSTRIKEQYICNCETVPNSFLLRHSVGCDIRKIDDNIRSALREIFGEYYSSLICYIDQNVANENTYGIYSISNAYENTFDNERNIIIGNAYENTFDNERNIIIGTRSDAYGSLNLVLGANQVVYGTNNISIGVRNSVTGNNNLVVSNDQKINGNDSTNGSTSDIRTIVLECIGDTFKNNSGNGTTEACKRQITSNILLMRKITPSNNTERLKVLDTCLEVILQILI